MSERAQPRHECRQLEIDKRSLKCVECRKLWGHIDGRPLAEGAEASLGPFTIQEIKWINRARAIARRAAMREMAEICDGFAKELEIGNPGRKRGSVSHAGKTLADVAKQCGDKIWAIRDKVKVI
jgi:hypothetical protein